MEKYQCLVCGSEMIENHKISFIDYVCNTNHDHHLSWRVKNDAMIKLRIRFNNKKEKLCLKVHYDESYSEVWNEACAENRFRINQIVIPNFEDIEVLKNKIRTILVFG